VISRNFFLKHIQRYSASVNDVVRIGLDLHSI